MFTVQKDIENKWYKNDLGEVVTKDNIDSYIPEFTTDDARYELHNLQAMQEEINRTKGSWDDYNDNFNQGDRYLQDYARSHNVLESSVDDLNVANQKAREAAIAHNAALKQQTLGAKATSVALKALSIVGNTLAGVVISQIITSCISLVEKFTKVSERANALTEEMNSLNSVQKNNIKTLSQISSKYDEYRKKVDALGQNISLTTEEHEDYYNICSQIAEIMPDMVSYYNSQNQAIIDTTKSLAELTNEYKKQAQQQAQDFLAFGSNGNTVKDILEQYDKSLNGDLLSGALDSFGDSNIFGDTFKTAVKRKGTAEALKQLKEALEYNDISDFQSAFKSAFRKGTSSTSWVVASLLRDLGYNSKIKESDLPAIKKGITNAINTLEKQQSNTNVAGMISIIKQSFVAEGNRYFDIKNETLKNGLDKMVQNINHDFIQQVGLTTVTGINDFVNKTLNALGNENGAISKAFLAIYDPKSTMEQISDNLRTIQSFYGVSDLNTMYSLFGVEDLVDNYKTIEKNIDNAINSIFKAKGKEWNLKERNSLYSQISDYIKKQSIDTQDEIANYMKALEEANFDLYTSFAIYKEKYLSSSEESSPISSLLSDSQNEAIETYEGLLDKIKKVYQEYDNMSNIDVATLFKGSGFDFTNFLLGDESLDATLNKLAKYAYENVRKNFRELSDNSPIIIDLENKKNGLKANAFGWSDALHNINTLEPFLQKIKDGVVFTMEELDAYIKEYDLSKNILKVDGGYKVDQDAVETLFNSAKGEYNAAIALFRDYLRDQGYGEDAIDGFFGSLNKYYDLPQKSSSSSKKIFDWIEPLIENAKKSIENAEKIANNTYASFEERTDAFNEQINSTLETIDIYDKAYKAYMEEANKIGLEQSYIDKIQKGQLKIDTLDSDENKELIEKIESYQSLWEDAKKCIESSEELENNLIQIQEELFNLTKTEADLYIDDIKRSIESLEQELRTSEYLNNKDKLTVLDSLSNKSQELAEKSYATADALQKLYDKLVQIDGFEANGEIGKGLLALIEGYKATGKESELTAIEYNTQRFDELTARYERVLVDNENRKKAIETELAKAEAQGYINTANYYNHLINEQITNQKTNNEKLTALQEELTKLESEYPNFENSDVWHEKKMEIDEVTLALKEGELQLLEYANAIRQIKWDVFDFLQDQIETVNDEASFLIDLFSNIKQFDEKGQFTDVGWATIGNHAVIYETSLAKAKKYSKELANIEKDISENPNDTELLKRKNELVGLYQDETLAAENAKQAIIDMVEEGINLELKSLNELINSYKDALRAEKDLYDWQKKSANQSKNIAQLQKQLSAYENDKSEEAKKKIQQIRVKLEDAQSDMEDMQYEHYISEQEDILTSLYEEYETILNGRMDNVDVLFKELMDDVNRNSSVISNTIKIETDKWGYELQTGLDKIWDIGDDIESSIGDATSIGGLINGTIGDLQDSIGEIQGSINDKLEGIIDDFENTVSTTNSNVLTSIKDIIGDYYNLVANEGGYWQKLMDLLSFLATDLTNIRLSIENKETSSDNSSNTIKPEDKFENNNDTIVGSNNSGNADNMKDESTEKTYSVGDILTGVTGKWYEDEYGEGKSGSVTQLGATSWKIEKVAEKPNMKYPYHLVGYKDGKLAGSGWVSLSQLPKYHNGLKNATKDHWAITQDGGNEMIITRNGGVLTHISAGDSVIKPIATKNIYDMAINPDNFIQKHMPNVNIPNLPINLSSRNGMPNHIENHFEFNIDGVNDVDTLLREIKYDLQHDKKFENMIEDVMNYHIGNGKATDKYKYQW